MRMQEGGAVAAKEKPPVESSPPPREATGKLIWLDPGTPIDLTRPETKTADPLV